MAEKTRIALVGIGSWGMNYVRNLAALGVLQAVCDTDEQRLAGITRTYPNLIVTPSVERLAELPEVDGVVVATDTPQHYPVAEQLLAAGKHCLVEKPLADSPEKALKLNELAEENGLVLMVGHLLLYHPVVEYIHGMIQDNALGEVYYTTARRTNLGAIRRHENVMWSLAPHDISVVQYLLDQEPVAVSATGHAYVQQEKNLHDVTHLTLMFGDGKMAYITSSWLDPEKVRLTKIVGSERMVVFDDMDPRYKLQVHAKGVDWAQFNEPLNGSALKVRTGDVHVPFVKPTEPLRTECEEFIRCIETGDTPRSSGRQGYANVRILACADESLRMNGQPVETTL